MRSTGPNGPDGDLHRWRDVATTTDFHDGDLIAEMRNELPRLLDAVEAGQDAPDARDVEIAEIVKLRRSLSEAQQSIKMGTEQNDIISHGNLRLQKELDAARKATQPDLQTLQDLVAKWNHRAGDVPSRSEYIRERCADDLKEALAKLQTKKTPS